MIQYATVPANPKRQKDSIILQMYKQLHASFIYQNFITAETDKKTAYSKRYYDQ